MSAEKLFDDMADYIAHNRALLKEGRELELGELAVMAARLDQGAQALSDEQRVQYADKLDEVVQALVALEEELIHYKADVARELSGLSGMKKAATAYRTAEASDNYKPEE